MISLLVALQLGVAVPPHLSPKDSAKLVAHVRDVEFLYIMDWPGYARQRLAVELPPKRTEAIEIRLVSDAVGIGGGSTPKN